MAKDSNDEYLWIKMSLLYKEMGDFGASLKSYKKALKINPESAQAQYDIAILFKFQGD